MRRTVAILAGLLVLFGAFWFYVCVYRSRPYWVTEIDLEQDYLYNAKLIQQGSPVASIHHPGTPIYVLGALLLGGVGSDVARTQRFFDAAYLVIFIWSAAAIAFFASTALEASAPVTVLLSVVVLLAWPSFLFHLNYFGADAFVVPVGLPTATIFWRIVSGTGANRWLSALFGVGLGLCLAVKMSFLPVVAAMIAGWAVHAARSWNSAPRWERRSITAGAALVPVGLIGGHLLMTLPILPRLPQVWFSALGRPDARPRGGHLWSSLSTMLGLLARHNPPFVLLCAGVLATTIWSVRRSPRRPSADEARRPTPPELDRASAAVFVTVGLIGLFYTLAAAAGDWAPQLGSRLRNASPSALVLSFAVLFCARGIGSGSSLLQGALGPGLLVLGLLALAAGIARELTYRNRLIREHVARTLATRLRLERLGRLPGRVAFWTGYQDDLGDVGFHFWGDYRYAHSQFDAALLGNFPRYTMLQLRDFGLEPSEVVPAEAVRPSRFGSLGEALWRFRRWAADAPDPYPNRRPSLFAGDHTGVRLSAVVFPETERPELRGRGEDELRRRLEKIMGPTTAATEEIAGAPWRLITADAAGATP